jgi:hypothetical protein
VILLFLLWFKLGVHFFEEEDLLAYSEVAAAMFAASRSQNIPEKGLF